MAAEFIVSHVLHRVEIGDFLAHNGAHTGNLRDTLELEGQASTRDDIRPVVVVAATRSDICAVALLKLQCDGRRWHQDPVLPVNVELRENPGRTTQSERRAGYRRSGARAAKDAGERVGACAQR